MGEEPGGSWKAPKAVERATSSSKLSFFAKSREGAA